MKFYEQIPSFIIRIKIILDSLMLSNNFLFKSFSVYYIIRNYSKNEVKVRQNF